MFGRVPKKRRGALTGPDVFGLARFRPSQQSSFMGSRIALMPHLAMPSITVWLAGPSKILPVCTHAYSPDIIATPFSVTGLPVVRSTSWFPTR